MPKYAIALPTWYSMCTPMPRTSVHLMRKVAPVATSSLAVPLVVYLQFKSMALFMPPAQFSNWWQPLRLNWSLVQFSSSTRGQSQLFWFYYQPGQENLGDYPSKHHTADIHQHVCPYYVHMYNSPTFLPRAAKPSSRWGCVDTLADPYKGRIPLPSGPNYQEHDLSRHLIQPNMHTPPNGQEAFPNGECMKLFFPTILTE